MAISGYARNNLLRMTTVVKIGRRLRRRSERGRLLERVSVFEKWLATPRDAGIFTKTNGKTHIDGMNIRSNGESRPRIFSRQLFLLCLLASASLSMAQPAPISIRDFRSLVGLENLTVSPDGKWVALVKTTSNYTNDQKDAKLIVVSTSTGVTKTLAMGSRQAASPHWSPHGDEIAFLSKSKQKQDEVFVIPAKGGGAKQLTHSLHGVQQYAWSPNGDRIAYVTQDDPINAAALARHDDLFDVHNVGFMSAAPSTPSHLWVVSRASGTATRLTSGSWSVLETPGPFVAGPADPSWSADGSRITFCRQANADNSDGDLSQVAVVDVATKSVTELTDKTTYEYQATFSPIADTIAYAHPESMPLSCQYVWSTDGAKPLLTPDANLNITQFSFMPDGRSIIALADRNIEQALFQTPLGGAPRELNMSGLSASEFAVGARGTIAMVASSDTSARKFTFMTIQVRRRGK
jgi:Tol biopolymer transport system component